MGLHTQEISQAHECLEVLAIGYIIKLKGCLGSVRGLLLVAYVHSGPMPLEQSSFGFVATTTLIPALDCIKHGQVDHIRGLFRDDAGQVPAFPTGMIKSYISMRITELDFWTAPNTNCGPGPF
jgi:hypothetical protein